MSVTVYVPTPFRRITANRQTVTVEGKNVQDVLQALEQEYPEFGDLVFDRDRRIPAHINIYLNNQEIHDLEGTATAVEDGDQIAVIPALAGGAKADDD